MCSVKEWIKISASSRVELEQLLESTCTGDISKLRCWYFCEQNFLRSAIVVWYLHRASLTIVFRCLYNRIAGAHFIFYKRCYSSEHSNWTFSNSSNYSHDCMIRSVCQSFDRLTYILNSFRLKPNKPRALYFHNLKIHWDIEATGGLHVSWLIPYKNCNFSKISSSIFTKTVLSLTWRVYDSPDQLTYISI